MKEKKELKLEAKREQRRKEREFQNAQEARQARDHNSDDDGWVSDDGTEEFSVGAAAARGHDSAQDEHWSPLQRARQMEGIPVPLPVGRRRRRAGSYERATPTPSSDHEEQDVFRPSVSLYRPDYAHLRSSNTQHHHISSENVQGPMLDNDRGPNAYSGFDPLVPPEGLDPVLAICVKHLWRHARTPQLFRTSPNALAVQKLFTLLQRVGAAFPEQQLDSPPYDPYVVAGVLKKRMNRSQTLVPPRLNDVFLDAVVQEHFEVRLRARVSACARVRVAACDCRSSSHGNESAFVLTVGLAFSSSQRCLTASRRASKCSVLDV